MLEKVKQFVDKSLEGKGNAHYIRTIFWIKELNPGADEALLIAAYSHDIERILRKKDKTKTKEFDKGEILVKHQVKGGEIMFDFLVKNGASRSMAKRVQDLISKHEVGGTADQNLLKDADAISLLENNAEKAIRLVKDQDFPKEEVKRKFDLTYDKITSEKAKQIAKQFYDRAINMLEAC
ncbi:DUF4202 family protein [archaeon]|jgi:hypothetical protein|nr:DUF4202 family protein [archaeon]MBT3450597.1 DUF4202 family protein [archaeon]MBT6868717.1 DUF4202 family protein [archaeon]MBT7193505.1 DUF4202 family protein [archaeon]MBT7381096.1 DUF4202 family protein [archaeon]